MFPTVMVTMDLGLCRKGVAVTGAANGIGTAVFMRLIELEAFPIGIDIEPMAGSELETKVREAAIHLGHADRLFTFYQGDASDEARMTEIFADIARTRTDGLYGLVNNAGILGNDTAHGGRTIAAWEKMMRNHAQAAYVATERAYPLMKEGGAIVNIGSIETVMAAPDVVLYTAAKGAMQGMTVAYATALAPKGIRVNMVSPGNVNTPRNVAQYEAAAELIRGFEAHALLGRSVGPEEVADLVLFLLSGRASAITGQNHVIDCGYTRALYDPAWSGPAPAK